VALRQRLNLECREIGIARCEVEPELDWSGALRCVHLKSSRNPAAKRNRAACDPRCIVRSRLSSVYCERLSSLWVISGHRNRSAECPLYPQKQTSVECCGMSAMCQLRTHTLQQRRLGTARTQAGALLTSHIAPERRTLAPFRCAASASRTDAVAAETTSVRCAQRLNLRDRTG